MIKGVEDELGKHPYVFDLLTKASQKPLYLGYIKFNKLSVVLRITNIKSKSIGVTISQFHNFIRSDK